MKFAEPILFANTTVDMQNSNCKIIAETRVRVVMASSHGDVGITKNLKAERGYDIRVPVMYLDNFSDKP
jgi:uncharacterized protein YtpQ (UPF0354 family)